MPAPPMLHSKSRGDRTPPGDTANFWRWYSQHLAARHVPALQRAGPPAFVSAAVEILETEEHADALFDAIAAFGARITGQAPHPRIPGAVCLHLEGATVEPGREYVVTIESQGGHVVKSWMEPV